MGTNRVCSEGWVPINNFMTHKIHESFRVNLLKHVDSDIICINETHLKTTQVIELECYQFYGHYRTSIHVNAPKGFGGVGIFVRNTLFDTFDISVIDRSHDGILGIALPTK